MIGSGTMGRGIAIVLARAGLPVRLIDTSEDALAAAGAFLDDYFSREVEKGAQRRQGAADTRSDTTRDRPGSGGNRRSRH